MSEENIKGIISGVSIQEGISGKGKWKRAAIKVRQEDGKEATISTFDENDINLANANNGKEVELKFTENKKGDVTYRNLVKDGIKVTGIGETPVTSEEKVGEPQKTLVIPDDRTQILIVRQNTWSQAMKYAENCLRSVELGILTKEEFNKEDLNIDSIKDIAHKVEDDIMRTKNE